MPMVTMRYFAHIQSLAGCASEPIELPAQADVPAIHQAVSQRHPQVSQLLRYARIAHNHNFIQHTVTLHDGDELAIIPPVSGG